MLDFCFTLSRGWGGGWSANGPWFQQEAFSYYGILTSGYQFIDALVFRVKVRGNIFKALNKYYSDYSGFLFHFFRGDMVNNDDDANKNHLLNGHYVPDIVLGSL